MCGALLCRGSNAAREQQRARVLAAARGPGANTRVHGASAASHREHTRIDKKTAEALLTRIRAVPFRVRDQSDGEIREIAFSDVPLGAPQVCLVCRCVRACVRACGYVCEHMCT